MKLDFSAVEVLDNDILIVCSDGVTEGADIGLPVANTGIPWIYTM